MFYMIFKHKNMKRFTAIGLVVVAVWVIAPSRFVNAFLINTNASPINASNEATTESKTTDDYTIGKYNSPSYFNVFKFLTSFMPSKPQSGKAI